MIVARPAQPRRPTMKDVAERAGVSRALVSIVFRDAPGAGPQTREKVLRAAAELGYERDAGARALRTGRSRLLGVVFDTRDDFHADLLDVFHPAVRAREYDLLLSAVTSTRSQAEAIATLVTSRVEGIVVLGSRTRLDELVAGSPAVPVVVVGWAQRPEEGLGVDVVRTDEVSGVGEAVDRLVSLGHRDIACVEASGHPAGADRVASYRDSMRRHRLTSRIRVVPGDFTHRGGREAAAVLLGDLPTAVLASNDACAVGLVQTLRASGVEVPRQVSVVGFDGSHIASQPDLQLSTIAQDVEGMARLAVAVLTERIVDPSRTPTDHVLHPRFQEGATTGPAPTQRSGH